MADEATTTTDTSGIERTTDGQIVDQTGADQSKPSTNQEQTKTETETSLLNQQEKKTETKVEEKKEGTEEKKAEKKDGPPETYADYTMPEGFTLDPEVKTKADGLFKELGLSQEGAQKAVDMFRELTTEAFQQPFKAYQEMRETWRNEALAHAELKGKLGPGQEINVRIAKALNSLPDQQLATDFKRVMDETGAGDNPAFIRVLNHFAKLSTEGSHVAGNGPSKDGQSAPGEAPPSAAAAMWPNLPSSQRG